MKLHAGNTMAVPAYPGQRGCVTSRIVQALRENNVIQSVLAISSLKLTIDDYHCLAAQVSSGSYAVSAPAARVQLVSISTRLTLRMSSWVLPPGGWQVFGDKASMHGMRRVTLS